MPELAPAQPFTAALRAAAERVGLPTGLGSDVLEAIPAAIRKRALILARVANASVVDAVQQEVERMVVGVQPAPGDYANAATFRERMRRVLDLTSYRPEAGREGTISDLRTPARLNLIARTETQLTQGTGQHLAQNRPTALILYPALELIREESRHVPRGFVTRKGAVVQVVANYWAKRWQEAGGQLFDGRMVARVNDPVWTALSRFGRPHPPFDFNSGMGVKRIGRREAVRLGVIAEGERVAADPDAAQIETAVPAPELGRQVMGALEQVGLRVNAEGMLSEGFSA